MCTSLEMKPLLFLVLLCVALQSCNSALPPPEKTHKILMLLPFASKSHRNVFLPIANGLAERGHKVVIVSPLSPATNHANIHEIDHGIKTHDEKGENMFEVREKDSSGGFGIFKQYLPEIARGLYKHPEVKKLYEMKDEFDVVMVDSLFNEPAYPFTHERPFILVSTAGKMHTFSATQGNVLNPSFVPFFQEFDRPYSFISRIKNLFSTIGFAVMWRRSIVPLVQTEISAQFPELPPLLELERNVSLVLMNSHFSMDVASPSLPNQVEVGGMHCKPAKPLPQDVKQFVESADEGVVYFSLGSVTKGSFMPQKYRDILVGAFGRLKQKVIFKYEDDIPNLPKNILKKSWLPQQDILGHPNVKVFITHGGLLSCMESIYHGTPLIALPIFGDQPKNGEWVRGNGYGFHLVWEELTEDMLFNAIQEVISDPKYQKNVAATSKAFRDTPMHPRDVAVWWTEYVIRHQGAPAAQSPGAKLSWIEYLMLDVLALVHLILYIFYFFCKKIISFFSKSPSPKKHKQN